MLLILGHRKRRQLPDVVTVGEAATLWLARGRGNKGRWALPLVALDVDRVAAWSEGNERALAPTRAKIALITLQQVCRFAVRRSWMPTNPVTKLEPGEKPRWTPREVSILEGEDLARVLAHTDGYRLLFETLVFTGLRIGELLGLTWADVDFARGTIHVHRQLSRHRTFAPLKTKAGIRHVGAPAALLVQLRAHRLGSAYKTADDLVFCTSSGRGRDYRLVGNIFREAVKQSGVRTSGRLSTHSLRHGFASALIGSNINPQFVSRQLGHANPGVTLEVYSHLFAAREHGDLARLALERAYTAIRQHDPPATAAFTSARL